jgi:preprotein translocase subunit SecD
MLFFSRAKTIMVVAVVAVVCSFAIPNFLPPDVFEHLPAWAQRHIVLGLDLQGGTHLLLEVDRQAVVKEQVQALDDSVRSVLRGARISYTGLAAKGDSVDVYISNTGDQQQALAKLQELSQPLGALLGATGHRNIEVADVRGGLIRLTVTPAALNERIHEAVGQSIEILERRVNALGTVEPRIESEGSDRIVVEVPGLQDPSRLKVLIGKTAKLTFQLVDLSETPEQALSGHIPPNSEILNLTNTKPPVPVLVQRQVLLSGNDLTDAQPGFDPRTNAPIVTFRLNSNGARRFAQVTENNVGRPFAIVLDNQVISAPVIREPILDGSGEISGNFTVQQANDLAVLLRAGALPAPLSVIEERTIGPGLGQDSIRSGEIASAVGAAFVVVSMLAIYGLFGLFADIAVAINVAMIFGLLSLLDATLTLPGIAGIVLTVGIAVDSNVLIYERIREEVRNGRSAIAAIDAGFARALATILDSNVTTLIAAMVLFFIGTGPVRGFAVTLGIGILTTVFTAFTLTRLLVATWVRARRPRLVPI